MLVAIVDHVAALAERLEIFRPIIRRIVIEVGGREHDLGPSNEDMLANWSDATQRPSAPISPSLLFFVPPSTVAQVLDLAAVRPAALLAPTFRSMKPDHRRQLRPVDRIEPFVLRADRHRAF